MLGRLPSGGGPIFDRSTGHKTAAIVPLLSYGRRREARQSRLNESIARAIRKRRHRR